MAKKGTKKTSTARAPRRQPLPGMEDARIPELEDIAQEYADIRDRRMELNLEEAKLKKKGLSLMHKYKKTTYRHETIEIEVEPPDGDEKFKVKIKKAKADKGDD